MYSLIFVSVCFRKTVVIRDETFPPFTTQQQACISVLFCLFVSFPVDRLLVHYLFLETSWRGIRISIFQFLKLCAIILIFKDSSIVGDNSFKLHFHYLLTYFGNNRLAGSVSNQQVYFLQSLYKASFIIQQLSSYKKFITNLILRVLRKKINRKPFKNSDLFVCCHWCRVYCLVQLPLFSFWNDSCVGHCLPASAVREGKHYGTSFVRAIMTVFFLAFLLSY